MELIVQTIIYLVAVFGIMMTTMVFINSNNKLQEKYGICDEYDTDNKVEIIIRLNIDEDKEKEEILNKIKNGEYENIYEIADLVKIVKI